MGVGRRLTISGFRVQQACAPRGQKTAARYFLGRRTDECVRPHTIDVVLPQVTDTDMASRAWEGYPESTWAVPECRRVPVAPEFLLGEYLDCRACSTYRNPQAGPSARTRGAAQPLAGSPDAARNREPLLRLHPATSLPVVAASFAPVRPHPGRNGVCRPTLRPKQRRRPQRQLQLR